MTHRRPSRLLAVALGAGLLLSGATAAGAAPASPDRAPHGTSAHHRDTAHKADRALEKLRRAVLEDVARAQAGVARASSTSKKAAGLTTAHRESLVAAAAAVRADLTELRGRVVAADSRTRLLALRRAVPSHAGSHLSTVVRLVAGADRAISASTAADALLTAAHEAAVAAGKDVSGVQEDVAVKLANAATARVKAAGDADAALAVGRALAEKRLPSAVKTVGRSVGALKSATDDVEDLTDEVEDLPEPAVVEVPGDDDAPDAPDELEDETPDADEDEADETPDADEDEARRRGRPPRTRHRASRPSSRPVGARAGVAPVRAPPREQPGPAGCRPWAGPVDRDGSAPLTRESLAPAPPHHRTAPQQPAVRTGAPARLRRAVGGRARAAPHLRGLRRRQRPVRDHHHRPGVRVRRGHRPRHRAVDRAGRRRRVGARPRLPGHHGHGGAQGRRHRRASAGRRADAVPPAGDLPAAGHPPLPAAAVLLAPAALHRRAAVQRQLRRRGDLVADRAVPVRRRRRAHARRDARPAVRHRPGARARRARSCSRPSPR